MSKRHKATSNKYLSIFRKGKYFSSLDYFAIFRKLKHLRLCRNDSNPATKRDVTVLRNYINEKHLSRIWSSIKQKALTTTLFKQLQMHIAEFLDYFNVASLLNPIFVCIKYDSNICIGRDVNYLLLNLCYVIITIRLVKSYMRFNSK